MSSSHDTGCPQPRQDPDGDTPHVSPAPVDSTELRDATAAWRALAQLLAGRPFIREQSAGGDYLAKHRRPLTDLLPAKPAAIPIYADSGDTRMLVIDLDTSKTDRATVLRDAAAVQRLVEQAGGRWISDESVSGGIHLYVPLAQPVAFQDARRFALALASRTPSMDAKPMLNLKHGLIRPPGARHRLGGFQRLHGTLAAAYDVAKLPNPASVWDGLRRALSSELDVVRHNETARSAVSLDDDGAGYVPRSGGARELAADYLRIAVDGLYDAGKYGSDSEARQAVLASSVFAGMTLADVIGRMESGVWAGMNSFYARYRYPAARRKALIADWKNALSFVRKAKQNDAIVSPVRISPTSTPSTQRGSKSPPRIKQTPTSQQAEFRFLREWWTALALLEPDRYTGRTGPAVRMLLRALGEAGMKTGSRYIEFGTRALDLASGMDHTTVAAHLRTLRSEDDPLIELIEGDRGLLGDLYELRIPDSVAERASRMDWKAGKIRALRPAFRDLGLPAAFVYEALEQAKTQPTSFELTEATGMARSTVYEALETLAAFNLVQQRSGRWSIVSTTSLALLAESLGCADVIVQRLTRHRLERIAYRRVLHIVSRYTETDVPDELLRGSPSDGETALELLERILGARRIA